jgi:hypothetical protein
MTTIGGNGRAAAVGGGQACRRERVVILVDSTRRTALGALKIRAAHLYRS